MPLFFASNAIYPLAIMPPWLHIVARVNPLSYEVDALRALMIVGGSSAFGLVADFALLTGTQHCWSLSHRTCTHASPADSSFTDDNAGLAIVLSVSRGEAQDDADCISVDGCAGPPYRRRGTGRGFVECWSFPSRRR